MTETKEYSFHRDIDFKVVRAISRGPVDDWVGFGELRIEQARLLDIMNDLLYVSRDKFQNRTLPCIAAADSFARLLSTSRYFSKMLEANDRMRLQFSQSIEMEGIRHGAQAVAAVIPTGSNFSGPVMSIDIASYLFDLPCGVVVARSMAEVGEMMTLVYRERYPEITVTAVAHPT